MEKPYFRGSEPLQAHCLSQGFSGRIYSSLSGFTGFRGLEQERISSWLKVHTSSV